MAGGKIKISFIIFLLLNGAEAGKAKLFGIMGFTTSIVAIAADIGSEHFYDKYQNATAPEDCLRYRKITQFYEKVRDISFGFAVINFSLSTIFLLNEPKEFELDINYQKGKICFGMLKSCW
ncbi:MAG: hypothetical protein ABIL39_08885 [candidate division WOR-3 bacterium]